MRDVISSVVKKVCLGKVEVTNHYANRLQERQIHHERDVLGKIREEKICTISCVLGKRKDVYKLFLSANPTDTVVLVKVQSNVLFLTCYKSDVKRNFLVMD